MTEYIYQPGTALGEAERKAEHEQRMIELQTSADERQIEREQAARFHSVTVTTQLDDEGTLDECRRVDQVKFTCTAPAEAECRTYPDSCGCESFAWNEARTHDIEGHPRTIGNECWMQGWFDNEGAVYVGDGVDDMRDDYVPAVNRTGLVVISPIEEWIEWDWFTPSVAGSKS
ncbi:hypothetical protein [Cryobacterium cryoconiti]|uniref:Uncharacterized protein n=1 Tax=Cryobacterium cryoconiti TaxID=1259239 RepID=A0A4Y8JRC2_9MICO|nr:hypothetical protein [Cryobacterium cryoconiti]TFD27468.1 hypothetical protein E3T49_13065 [Cryobacterium cryoconiti]